MSIHESLPVAIVAESDEETRGLIRSLLELLGFAVIEVSEARQVYESAICYQPDLIVVELKVPLLFGFTAIRRIKRQSDLGSVQIVALSTRQDTSNHNLALAAGCSALVHKPIEFDRLESVVESLIPCDRLSIVSSLIH